MSEPLVSIIIPVFNVASYLDDCFESIVNQDYDNLEIIVIDDGSSDSSLEICNTWALRDNRITVIHKSNGGVSDARNRGLLIAKGEYISFVDSDDTVQENFISSLVNAIARYGTDVVQCGYRRFGLSCGEYAQRQSIVRKENSYEYFIKAQGITSIVWDKLFRRSLLEQYFVKNLKTI